MSRRLTDKTPVSPNLIQKSQVVLAYSPEALLTRALELNPSSLNRHLILKP